MTNASTLSELNKQILSWGKQNELAIDCLAYGKFDSEIAIIGNYVHEGDKLQGIPFTRGYGETLWNALRIEKLNRSDVYSTFAIKKLKVSLDPKKGVQCSKEEIDSYGAMLRWELAQLPNIKYLIVLGDFALRCLTDLPSNMLCQGSVYDHYINYGDGETRQCKLIVVIDPDTVLKSGKFKITLANNLKRLTRVLNGTYVPTKINTIYNESSGSVINYIRDLMRAKLPTALDIETLKMETACIGLANKPTEALCINFIDAHGNRYNIEDELRIRTLLQHWFNRKDEFKAKLVMQNGMFDSYWLGYKDRMRLPPSYFDTMLASHTLASTMPHGLDYLVSVYTDMPYYKDQGKQWKDVQDFPAYWGYNGQDCCGTLQVHYKQHDELSNIILPEHFNRFYGFRTMLDFFQGHVMRLQPHLVRMTVGGVKADEPLKEQLGIDISNDIELIKTKIYALIAELTGDAELKPNLNSTQQLADLFFNKLRLVGRGQATDDENRQRMINHPKTPPLAREMLIAINKYKKDQKFLSTYIGMKVDEDGRIRCEYKQTGVEKAPGRLSSTSVMWESGANLQNQPPKAQELFECDEGYEFTYFDLAQAEARVVGWRYYIKQWISDFEAARSGSGFDAHRSLASMIYNMSYDDVPKDDIDQNGEFTIRYKSKRARHGFNYTMEAPTFATQNELTLEDATYLYNKYHRINPELKVGWEWSFKIIQTQSEMYNAYGRRYTQLARLDPKDLGNIVAFYFQSTIGDKVSRCIYLCEDDPEWPKDARMLLNIHDALIAINRPEDRDTVIKIMKKYANEVIHVECIDKQFRELIIPADFKISVPYKVKYVNNEKVKIPDKHRWSNLDKIKLVA